MKGLNDPSKTFDACKSTIKPRQTGYNGVEEEEGRGGDMTDKTRPWQIFLDGYEHTERKSRTLKIEHPTELIHRCADKGTRRCVALH